MDRRDYYRIEDRVHLVQTPIERHLISDNPYGDQYNLPRQALLVSQLQSIDNDTKELCIGAPDNVASAIFFVDDKFVDSFI